MEREFDPNSDAHKLLFFWRAYHREAELLLRWHKFAKNQRQSEPDGPIITTNNILYDSFLDTWGKHKFENSLPMGEKSWFSALGNVSVDLREDCAKILKDIFVQKPDGTFKLEFIVSEEDANEKAQTKIRAILHDLELDKRSLDKLDAMMEDLRRNNPDDDYLEALQQLMLLETRCFATQIHFLKKGEILTVSA